MGSVKDLKVLENATEAKTGRARFEYSGRFSVFDWGEMPDLIDLKGEAIAVLGAYFFEKLEKMNIPTHYIGLVEDGEVKRLNDLQRPSNVMEVEMLRVIKPGLQGNVYDYSMYSQEKGGFLIPLEVIYRNTLPPGSSVFKRLERGEISPQDLGLSEKPYPNQKLDKPILDVSTKLEVTDRYITWKEAGVISGLNDKEIGDLKELVTTINKLISDEFARIGLINEDGKIEVGFTHDRRLMLVDVLGTLDECRFTYDGLPVSKEIMRIYYRDTPWAEAVEEAKNTDRQNWKEICKLKPEPLPPELKKLVSDVYCSCTNEITGKEWFKGVPSLEETMQKLKKSLNI